LDGGRPSQRDAPTSLRYGRIRHIDVLLAVRAEGEGQSIAEQRATINGTPKVSPNTRNSL